MLLGMYWKARFMWMLLSHLEFTAPDTITAVADAVEWVLRLRGVCDVEHYLDD